MYCQQHIARYAGDVIDDNGDNLRSNQLPRALKEVDILLLPYVRIAHIINNRSIAPIKASFIVALDRLLLIDYCITNSAVIKYSSNALRTNYALRTFSVL